MRAMLDWGNIIYLGLANYILSWFVVDAHVLDAPRHALKRDTPFLRFGGVHLFECRSCIAFWVALGMSIYPFDPSIIAPVWAISRILRMQEREVYD